MGKHWPSNMVSGDKWCNQCKKFTLHKCENHKLTYCLDCAAKAEQERLARPEAAPVLQREFKF